MKCAVCNKEGFKQLVRRALSGGVYVCFYCYSDYYLGDEESDVVEIMHEPKKETQGYLRFKEGWDR